MSAEGGRLRRVGVPISHFYSRELRARAKEVLQTLFRSVGYDIIRLSPLSHPLPRAKLLLKNYGIDLVLDVGANRGQFARRIRKYLGYAGRIVSFEPLQSEYRVLAKAASKDRLWEALHYGLGEQNSFKEMNVAGNSQSSSLLEMLPAHVSAEPESLYVGTETVDVRTLDSVYENLCHAESNVFLKIDAQGYENRILEGAAKSLPRINTIQLEMSLVPLYEGEVLFKKMYELLYDLGYIMVSIEPGFSDPRTGQLLQVDGVFHRL